jgi:hypothetical protein
LEKSAQSESGLEELELPSGSGQSQWEFEREKEALRQTTKN